MSYTATAARNSVRAAVTAALIVILTGAGVQASWADGTTGTTDATTPVCTTTVTATGPVTTCSTDNNPWD
ncbi:hypothetical protein ABZ926_19335 [Streptomyces litmocidini]|uniref:Uncharacterized protein n=1 Tax=Streptomyces litmocidini TaxID=67318 RepID=A0ABW7UA37_9ACTN|nr:hypothetical protein [Streptomyces sp. PanSC19]ROQ26723.1 hypothetical protein EDD98_6372 [Streptomyces sp. PanSC19]